MAIIISENGKNAHKVDESNFEIEDKLQSYIIDNPDAVPLYDIDEDIRLFIAAREFPTRSGSIDALGFDESGNIYVVETKLFKNPDKRTVIAQALDYGASLWKHSADFDYFISQLDVKSFNHFDSDFKTQYCNFFELDDCSTNLENICKNLESGVIKYVVLMDKLHDALKDLIVYVNQNSKFDVYAVELEYYKHKTFEIIIPKIYGAEVKKEVSTPSDQKRFNNQKILDWVNELNLNWLNVDKDKISASYLRLSTNFLDELIPPSNDTSGGWGNGRRYYYEIKTRIDGSVGFVLAFNNKENTPDQSEGQQTVIDFLSIKEKKPDWQWWYVKRFKLISRDGEEALKKEIQRITTVEIPRFEDEIKNYIKSTNHG